MRDPTPFWSKRIAFVDMWTLSMWVHDYKQFRMKPEKMAYKGGYADLVNGLRPEGFETKLKWCEDVDHLYGCLQTGRNHWVAYHVDLKKQKIDCYDSFVLEASKESEAKMLGYFKPLTEMLPWILNANVPAHIRTPSKKKFSFRRRSKKFVPQNSQVGDCGVYSLKFVECLALGVTFDGINDQTIQGLRVKMAAEILEEGGNVYMNKLMTP